MASKLVRRQPYFKSQKTTTIAQTSFSSFKPNPPKQPCLSLLFCQLEKKFSYFACCKFGDMYCPTTQLGFFCFAFAPPNMFLKAVDFGNQKLFSPFDLCAHPTSNHMRFPIKAKKNFCPWKLYCPIILKNVVYLPFLYPSLFIFLLY